MKICINPGHTLSGSGSGAIGIKNESIENRNVAKEVIRLLREQGHQVVPTIIDKASTQGDYLERTVEIANKNNCDLFVSIHFNSYNGSANGTETLIYSSNSKAQDEAARICNRISSLGFKNRGVKKRPDLYVLRNTKMPALLVECCFIDSKVDMSIYNPEDMARAIVEGLLNIIIKEPKPVEEPEDNDVFYRVCIGSFKNKENAVKLLEEAKSKGYEDAFIIKS